jgi:hypothetical protein
VLEERSANQPTLPPKQVRFSSSGGDEKEISIESDLRKPARLLKPVIVPKQVHLKVERAKRAALLLAQTAAAAASGQTLAPPNAQASPPKHLKRSLSSADNTQNRGRGDEASGRSRVALADSDELGLLTPMRKKRSSIRIGATQASHLQGARKKRMSSAAKVPVREMTHDGMSDDELGM